MTKLSAVQRLKSRKRARASLDMLSGPERFLKHVGPQIAYLPIAVSRADLAMHSLSRVGRPLLRCLESRVFLSYLCRVIGPAARRKFNCIGLVRKSIFRAARYESSEQHCDRTLLHFDACLSGQYAVSAATRQLVPQVNRVPHVLGTILFQLQRKPSDDMKTKNASCTCSTLRSFQRMFAQQAAS